MISCFLYEMSMVCGVMSCHVMSCHVVAGAAHTVIVVETEMGDIFGGFSGSKVVLLPIISK